MALPMVPIYTQTVGAGGAASVTFNNIPQFYTDLMIVSSARDSYANNGVDVTMVINNDSANNYSTTRLYGAGSGGGSSDRASGANAPYAFWAIICGSTNTTNTFASTNIYIPNYTSSNFKSIISDSTTENNATGSFQTLIANLWRNSASISTIRLNGAAGLVAGSTFSLYGILRAGA